MTSHSALRLMEWQVVLAAVAYERCQVSLLSDATYDIFCGVLHADGCDIPGFDKSTGMWANELADFHVIKAVNLAIKQTRGQALHAPLLREVLDEVGLPWKEHR